MHQPNNPRIVLRRKPYLPTGSQAAAQSPLTGVSYLQAKLGDFLPMRLKLCSHGRAQLHHGGGVQPCPQRSQAVGSRPLERIYAPGQRVVVECSLALLLLCVLAKSLELMVLYSAAVRYLSAASRT